MGKMNSGSLAAGALTSLLAIQPGCTDQSDIFTVTNADESFYKAPNIEVRSSRNPADRYCIEKEVNELQLTAGDQVHLALDSFPHTSQCLPASVVQNVSTEHDRKCQVTCQQETSIDHLQYLQEFFGLNKDAFVGFSITAEKKSGDYDIFFEAEGNIDDMVNPEILTTREDPKYGTVHTFQYQIPLSAELGKFAFIIPPGIAFPDTSLVANYWYNCNGNFLCGQALDLGQCQIQF